MLKKTIIVLSIIIILINIAYVSYEYIWPFIDRNGVIETGEYRELQIGSSKEDVIRLTTNPVFINKLKIIAYLDLNNNTLLVFTKNQPYNLLDSNIWIVSYPSIHKETIKLYFKDNRLTRINYQRDLFSP